MNLLSIFAQQGPAETTSYFIAGYVIFFSVMLIYLASYFVRFRNLKQDIALLEDLESDE
jgi:hypothetical protein